MSTADSTLEIVAGEMAEDVAAKVDSEKATHMENHVVRVHSAQLSVLEATQPSKRKNRTWSTCARFPALSPPRARVGWRGSGRRSRRHWSRVRNSGKYGPQPAPMGLRFHTHNSGFTCPDFEGGNPGFPSRTILQPGASRMARTGYSKPRNERHQTLAAERIDVLRYGASNDKHERLNTARFPITFRRVTVCRSPIERERARNAISRTNALAEARRPGCSAPGHHLADLSPRRKRGH
jgi:hypothetical protein